ncbi:hypothetical protein CR513_17151, partial [Mucuna pruriens]
MKLLDLTHSGTASCRIGTLAARRQKGTFGTKRKRMKEVGRFEFRQNIGVHRGACEIAKSRAQTMPITRNQASSTNKGEEDTLQRLLRVVASLQERSDEQSRLNAKAEQRQAKAEERYRLVEERHLEAMKMAERREEELRQQIATFKTTERQNPTPREENSIQPFWGQPFASEIDETCIPPNFREIVVEPFDGTQDPYAYLQAFQA